MRTPPYCFVKYAGGKTRLLQSVVSRLPKKINTYFEPMVGGGAVFIELAKQKRFKRAVISDVNVELVNAWNIIKANPLELIDALKQSKYSYDKESYLKVRSHKPEEMTWIDRAARFIYLNKTAFNGLWRVNSRGEFNVPFGKYKNPVICDAANIVKMSELLTNASISLSEFNHIAKKPFRAKAGDAVYFDPPYIPVSATSNFTAYTKEGFGVEEHRKLAKLFKDLGNKGVRVVLTNSDSELTHELYDEYDMDVIKNASCIGGPAKYRKKVSEIIVFHGPRA